MKKREGLLRTVVIDAAIIMVLLLGLGNIFLAFPHAVRPLRNFGRAYSFLQPQTAVLHRTLSTVTGVALIFISTRLFGRNRMAWMMTVCLIPISALLHIFGIGHIGLITLIEALLEVAFLANVGEFRRKADPITLRTGLLMACLCVALVLIDTAVGLFAMRRHFIGIHSFFDAFANSFGLLFLMNTSSLAPRGPTGLLYARSAIVLYWSSFLASLFFILKPLIYEPIVSNRDRERVRDLLAKYCRNPISYVDVENDKRYFFGTAVEGFVAYVTAGRVVVCAGDPVCAKKDMTMLVSEFMAFCRENDFSICFCQTTASCLDCFRSLGYGVAKYGEEAMFDLSSYTIRGRAAGKIRQNINRADREGVSVFEYKPLESRSREVEDGISAVSKDWLAGKKSGELSFLLGSVGLENPLDRRYFVARDRFGTVCAFIVFVPFLGGYYTDVTRRRRDAPQGVMEKIVVTAFSVMRAEGAKWGSIGLAPLSGLTEGVQTPVSALLHYVFEHMNGFYGFKALYQYKKKYAPTMWEPRYMAYYPAIFTPAVAYAIVRVQNSGGVKDFLVNRARNLLRRQAGYHRAGKAE